MAVNTMANWQKCYATITPSTVCVVMGESSKGYGLTNISQSASEYVSYWYPNAIAIIQMCWNDVRFNMNWMVSATWWLPREKLQAWQAFVIWICDGISEQLGHPSVLVVLVVVVVVWYLIAVAALPPLLSCTSIVRPSAHRARALEHVHGQEA